MFKFDLHPQEKLILLVRQRESVLFRPVFGILLAVYLPWFLILKYEVLDQLYRLLFFWAILLLIYGTGKYLLWLLNVTLITNQRVIRVKYRNLFEKRVTEVELSGIVRASCVTSGLWAPLFDFGSIELLIAGAGEPFSIIDIKSPQRVKDVILKLKAGASL